MASIDSTEGLNERRSNGSNAQSEQVHTNIARALDVVRREGDRVRTVEDYKNWVRNVVQRVFPHERLVSGFGHQHGCGFSIDYLVTVDFPMRHLQQVRNRVGAIDSPVLRRSIAVREPQLFEVDHPWFDAPAEWVESLRRNGLVNVAAHGVSDSEACLASYQSFHRIPGRLGTWHVDVLGRMVPIMDEVLRRVIEHLHVDGGFADRLATLSAREMEIAQWVKIGKTNGEIAKLLSVSENTVKHHATNIFRKLGVESRVRLLQRLLEHQARTTPGLATRVL